MHRKPIFAKAVAAPPPAPPANAQQPVQFTERANPPLAWIREFVAANIELLMDLFVQGWSFKKMAAELEKKFPDLAISPSRLRAAILNSPRGVELYQQALIDRSHMLVDSALEDAENAARTGDSSGYRTAATIKMKIAGQLNPEYAERSSVLLHGTGKGGAIKTEAVVEELDDAALHAIAAGAIQKAKQGAKA